jgi:hypothetical protein
VTAMTASFYDELAPFYHLIYENWEDAISKQGAALAAVLRDSGIGFSPEHRCSMQPAASARNL